MNRLRDELRRTLERDELAPRKRLGQHFMVDAGVLECLLRGVEPVPGMRVCEIGPGTGVLTRLLLDAGCAVTAVELDLGLADHLERELVPRGLQLVRGDARAGKNALHPAIVDFAAADPWRVCANLPYDISIPLLLNCLALPRPPELLAVTVQLEAAQRLTARPGTAAWGASAAVAQAAGEGRILRRVPPRAFHPPPRVDSAILLWRPLRALAPGFGAWCRRLFAFRRKQITRALRDCGLTREQAACCVERLGLETTRRVETLTGEERSLLHAAMFEEEEVP